MATTNTPARHHTTRWVRLTGALTAGVAVVLLLTGCSSSGTTPTTEATAAVSAAAPAAGGVVGTTAVVASTGACPTGSSLTLIIPVHQGAQAPELPQQWQCAIESAITGAKPINIVTAEGKPQVVLRNYTATITTINPEATRDDLVAAQNTIISKAATATATSAGNDLLSALALSADLSSTTGPNGVILSLDNGLTDTGTIRLTDNGMTAATTTDITTFITTNSACPKLAGKNVQFYALGYATAPQLPLSQRQRDAITTDWTQIATTCGSATTTAIALPRTGTGPKTTYTTKTVTPDTDPVLPPTPTPTTPIRADDTTALGFTIDSDQLRDPTAATTFLTPIAEHLKTHPTTHVTLTGTTSNGPTAWPTLKDLATARATTVATLLITLGVPATQITTAGAGYTANPPVTDPATAALNRATTLTFT